MAISFNMQYPSYVNPIDPAQHAAQVAQQMQKARQAGIETGLYPRLLNAKMFSQEMGPLATLATSPYFQALMQQGGNAGTFNNIISHLLSSVSMGNPGKIGTTPVAQHVVNGPNGQSTVTSSVPEHQNATSYSDILQHSQGQAAGRTSDPVKNQSAQQVANWNLIKNELPEIEKAYSNVGPGDALLHSMGITNEDYRNYQTQRNILAKQLAPYGFTPQTLSRNTFDSGQDSANRIKNILSKVENKYAPAALDNMRQSETGNYNIQAPSTASSNINKKNVFKGPVGTTKVINGQTYKYVGNNKWQIM